ncbi:pyruvate kinase [bacterium]|nr:MAG: pyruvate kinase [bacterium]
MSILDRRTKIVCTIGPSTNTRAKIKELVLSGMNVARLNFSHGSHQDHAAVIEAIRSVSAELSYNIPILMDLQGPKIRVGKMTDDGQTLVEGSYVTITPEDVLGTPEIIPIDFPNLVEDAEEGDVILMDDGLLELRIVKKMDRSLQAVVVVGGLLKPRKGVNLPNVKITISSLTEKDIEDLDFGLSQGVDFVALSFVRHPRDVQELASRIRAKGSNAAIISKIEKPEALDYIDDIIEESDGIMVARGDLGIEIPNERVPLVQKMIIDKCKAAGKPVITATQMLDSMINNPRPTRAESSDVANAVLDGTDAVMLSGESASGKYPFEAVKTMAKICKNVEQGTDRIYHTLEFIKPDWQDKQVVESISYACMRMASFVDAKLIAVLTHSGTTAKRIAKYRPKVPILAYAENLEVRRQLNLVWGVKSVKIDELFDTDTSVQVMEQYLKDSGLVSKGDRVIIATGMPMSEKGRTNMLKVATIN